MRLGSFGPMALMLLAAATATPGIAAAHAFPAGASPPVGCAIDSPPTEVAINFDSPIESLFARLEVLNSAGHEETVGQPSVSADHRQLSVRLRHLAPGRFTVKWTIVSRDGHRAEGSYDFTLKGDGS